MMTIDANRLTVTRPGRTIPIQRVTDADRARALRAMGLGEWTVAGIVRGLITVGRAK